MNCKFINGGSIPSLAFNIIYLYKGLQKMLLLLQKAFLYKIKNLFLQDNSLNLLKKMIFNTFLPFNLIFFFKKNINKHNPYIFISFFSCAYVDNLDSTNDFFEDIILLHN